MFTGPTGKGVEARTLRPVTTPAAITIGNFDGVHIGHAALVARARQLIGPAGRVIAMAFDPHPMSVLRPQATPARLSTFEQRERWLRAAGADHVEKLSPTPDLLDLPPGEFVRRKLERFPASWFVEGEDFHFGRGRSGNVRVLAELGRTMGFGVDVVSPVEVALTDDSIVRASSSLVRWLVQHGRVRDAALMLGRPYEVAGVVRRGDRRGRTIGFPTANVATEQLLPADGVYAATAVLPDGREVMAAVNVGARPTFAGVERRIEAHLLDVAKTGDAIEGLPEYDWPIALRFVGFVRDQARFPDIASLAGQLHRDVAGVRARLEPVAERV